MDSFTFQPTLETESTMAEKRIRDVSKAAWTLKIIEDKVHLIRLTKVVSKGKTSLMSKDLGLPTKSQTLSNTPGVIYVRSY